MARISSYPKDSTIQDKDAWIGTESTNRATRNFTAEDVANYVITSTSAVTGSGTTNNLPIWSDGPSGVLGDSQLLQEVNSNGLYKMTFNNANTFIINKPSSVTSFDPDFMIRQDNVAKVSMGWDDDGGGFGFLYNWAGDGWRFGSQGNNPELTIVTTAGNEGVTIANNLSVNGDATVFGPGRFLNNITINDEYTLPSADGTADQIIATDGAGQLNFVDLSSIASADSNFVYFDVKNETGSLILKGKGVMAVGTDGNSGHILVDEMVADGSIESKYFLGVLEEDIPNGGFARVISFGLLSKFNTNGQNGETWADGQVLWCDPVNNGDFTITEPDGPNLKIPAAFILNSSTNGKIQVRVQANEGVHDLYDTKITSQVDGDVLVWDNTTGVWFNDSTLNVDYAAGNVGIGTTNPAQKLQVNGGVLSTLGLYSDFAFASNRNWSIETNTFGAGNWGGIAIKTSTSNGLDPSTTRFGIDSSGNVGIGTTSPNEKLEVNGNVRVTGAGLDVGYENNSNNFIQIGKGRTTNGSAFIDLIGDITYPDFGLRLVRSNGGADANSSIINRGGGTLSLSSSSGSITLKTSNVERVRVNSLGNVGIGTTNPGSKLEVQGGDIEVDSSASGLILKSPDGTRYRIKVANGGTLTVTAV